MGNRRRNDLLNLEVVLVQVLLEVEVRERLTLRHAEKLLEGSIRLDVVLVLEALLLDVGRHGLRDVGAAHLAALRLGEERAQVVTELGGDLKDGQTRRLGRTVLVQLRRTALALASILDLTGHTLLQLLELGVERGDRLTEAVQRTDHAADLITDRLNRLLNGRNRRRRRRRRRSGRNRRNGGRNSRRGNLGLGRSLLDRLLGRLGHRRNRRNRRRNRNRGRRRRSRHRLRLLLRYALDNRLHDYRGIHCTRSGGKIGRHFTHYLI